MQNRQKRFMFFVHDGIGLGHLSRMSKIAQGLQGLAACLVVSGYREMSWMVSKECEYIHLPNLYDIYITQGHRSCLR